MLFFISNFVDVLIIVWSNELYNPYDSNIMEIGKIGLFIAEISIKFHSVVN